MDAGRMLIPYGNRYYRFKPSKDTLAVGLGRLRLGAGYLGNDR